MKLRKPLLACILGASIISGAAGQRRSGEEITPPSGSDVSAVTRARILVQRFTKCVVEAQTARALAYIDAKYDRPGEDGKKARRALINDLPCAFDGKMELPVFLFRGEMFRVLYLKEDVADRLVEPAIDYKAFVIDPQAPNSVEYLNMMVLAGCVVRSNVGVARAYVVPDPGTAAETEALSALQPLLGSCFPAGASMKVSRPFLTAILSEALYREHGLGLTAQP